MVNVGLKEMMRTAIQFVATLAAAMLGECAEGMLIGFPMTWTRFWVLGVFWSAAALAYIIPRSMSQAFRTRILGCVLILSGLAAVLVWFLQYLRAPTPLAMAFAPLSGLFVFSVIGFLTGPRRGPVAMSLVFCPAVAVQFFSLWWLQGFGIGWELRIAGAELVPFVATVALLIVTDNLFKMGDNPTRQIEDIVA